MHFYENVKNINHDKSQKLPSAYLKYFHLTILLPVVIHFIHVKKSTNHIRDPTKENAKNCFKQKFSKPMIKVFHKIFIFFVFLFKKRTWFTANSVTTKNC